jgi:ABC-type sugar transport system permease subunit
LLVLIVFIPEVWALVLSFTDYRLGHPLRFVGFRNFAYVFSDVRFWQALIKNFLFVFVVVALQMLLGLLISLLLARQFPFQRVWLALILAPIAISPAVAAVMWRYLLNFNIGPINYILQIFGLKRLMWLSNPSLAFVSIIVVYVWQTTPNVVLLLYPARITFPQTLYEAASIDGANPWQQFQRITMPLLRPALYVALVFRIMIAFRTFGIVWTLTKGGPIRATELLAIYLFREGFKYWRFGTASAVAWVMLLFTILAASYQMRSMYKHMFAQ